MASGKQSKRKRQMQAQAVPSGKVAKGGKGTPGRTPPPVRAKGQGPGRPDNRTLAIAGGVLAVIAVAVVLAIVLTGGKSSSNLANVPTVGSLATGLNGSAQVAAMFKGIPQQGNVLGQPNAPVTVVEYIDLQCPYCQAFETSSLPTFVKDEIRTGKAKLEARPIAFIGPDSTTGRQGALAAAAQNRMFNLMEVLYLNQGTENTGWLTKDMVAAAAASVPGLRVHDVLNAMSSSTVSNEAKQNDSLMKKDNVTATPTFFVGKSGGKLKEVQLSSPTDLAALEAAVSSAS